MKPTITGPTRARVAPDQPAAPPPKHLGMVEWYNPLRLLLTGLQVLVWSFVGKGRPTEQEALSREVIDYGEGEELWFDFAADTGDGWNPTYAVASLIAQRTLAVGGRSLPRGRFLVIGGDAVYPVPSQQNYRERLLAPFEAALPKTEPSAPDLFAIPGNHDGYDGLVSFTRRFTQGRQIGGWQTRQAQSFFALKLPQGWWLWALDVLLGADMDRGQWDYFREAAGWLAPGDRVILVGGEPDWIKRNIRRPVEESHFGYVEHKIIAERGATVHLWLAGDIHHYRRHEKRDDRRLQRITSGGGGAYLHPTHRPARRTVFVGRDEYVRRAVYPSTWTSFRLSFLNLFFFVKNWKLGIVTGLCYGALTWSTVPAFSSSASWVAVFRAPVVLAWVAVTLAAFVVFAGRTRRPFRWVGGLAHGVAQVVCASLIVGGMVTLVPEPQWARFLLNLIAGAFAGPTLLGLYLLVALNIFGEHSDEAFSSLRIEGYKHFLRLHVTPEGRLEIYPIGIRRVPRGDDARAQYHLIEGPIVIDPSAPRQA